MSETGPRAAAWDASFMRRILDLLPFLPGANNRDCMWQTPEGSAAVHALSDIRDVDVQKLWDWLAAQPVHEIKKVLFVVAAVEAAHYTWYRASVRGTTPRKMASLPSRIMRMVGKHRKEGQQTDFLRVFGAALLNYRFDLDAPGLQVQTATVARAILDLPEVKASVVSAIWKELRADRDAHPT